VLKNLIHVTQNTAITICPKDAFHIACIANRIRINNTLRTPGINNVEREEYQQQAKNMTAAQVAYLKKQQPASMSDDCETLLGTACQLENVVLALVVFLSDVKIFAKNLVNRKKILTYVRLKSL
jgi:hypothetical protein